jgi:hypothetical protein
MIRIYAFVILWKDTGGVLTPAFVEGTVKVIIFLKNKK